MPEIIDLEQKFPYASALLNFQFALRDYGDKCRALNATTEASWAEHAANVKVQRLYNLLLTELQRAAILPPCTT